MGIAIKSIYTSFFLLAGGGLIGTELIFDGGLLLYCVL